MKEGKIAAGQRPGREGLAGGAERGEAPSPRPLPPHPSAQAHGPSAAPLPSLGPEGRGGSW